MNMKYAFGGKKGNESVSKHGTAHLSSVRLGVRRASRAPHDLSTPGHHPREHRGEQAAQDYEHDDYKLVSHPRREQRG